MRFSEWSVNRPVTVTMVIVGLILVGSLIYNQLPMNLLPNVEYPGIFLWIPYSSTAPQELEDKIIIPVENNISKLNDIESISSSTFEGGCRVMVRYNFNTNMDYAAMEVRETIHRIINDLPDDLKKIFIFKFDASQIPIMRFTITGNLTQDSLYDFVKNNFKYKMQRISGVGKVDIQGIGQKEVSIKIDNTKLLANKVTFFDVFSVVSQNNVVIPIGNIKNKYQEINLRFAGKLKNINQIKNILVKSSVNNVSYYLKDLADIEYDYPEETWEPRFNDKTGIIVNIYKKSNANTVEITDAVIKELKIVDNNNSFNFKYEIFFNQGQEIKNAIKLLQESGLIGAVIAIFVVYFFLRRFLVTLLITFCIPVSIFISFNFMYFAGISLNLMSLSGLMLSVGMLVDNAIVVIENIFRYREKRFPIRKASITGAQEVLSAVTASTVTSIIVFLPLIFLMKSMIGKLISEVGMTMVFALTCSLFVALSFIPMASTHLFKHKIIKQRVFIIDKIKKWYLKFLKVSLRYSFIIVILSVIFFALIVKFVLPEIKKEGMPQAEQRYFRLIMRVSPHMGKSTNKEYRNKIETFLLTNRDLFKIKNIFSYRDGLRTEFFCGIKDSVTESSPEVGAEVKKELPDLAGATIKLSTEHGHSNSSDLSFTFFGQSITGLESIIDDIENKIAVLSGIEEIKSDYESGDLELVINSKKDQKNNIPAQSLASIINMSVSGRTVTRMQQGLEEIDVIVKNKKEENEIESLKKIGIKTNSNTILTLENIADFKTKKATQHINRVDKQRAMRLNILFKKDVDNSKIIRQCTEICKNYNYPRGYSFDLGRKNKQDNEDSKNMMIACVLAIVLVYMVMASQFQSFLAPFAIMFTLPFAYIGVILILYFTDTSLNSMSMAGLLILIGIVVNNGIVLIDTINRSMRNGLTVGTSIILAAEKRFRPILITALTTILGLVPMSMGPSISKLLGIASGGMIVYYPLARTVIGGLCAATLLTLVLLPIVYMLLLTIKYYSYNIYRWILKV